MPPGGLRNFAISRFRELKHPLRNTRGFIPGFAIILLGGEHSNIESPSFSIIILKRLHPHKQQISKIGILEGSKIIHFYNGISLRVNIAESLPFYGISTGRGKKSSVEKRVKKIGLLMQH